MTLPGSIIYLSIALDFLILFSFYFFFLALNVLLLFFALKINIIQASTFLWKYCNVKILVNYISFLCLIYIKLQL